MSAGPYCAGDVHFGFSAKSVTDNIKVHIFIYFEFNDKKTIVLQMRMSVRWETPVLTPVTTPWAHTTAPVQGV